MLLQRLLSTHRLALGQQWPWLLGITLLSASAMLWFIEIPKLHAQATSNRLQAHSLQAKVRIAPISPVAGPALNLHQRLAPLSRLSAITNDLQTQASQNGLTLSDANFKPMDDAIQGEIGRMEIVAHLKGSYPPLKKALAALLNTHDSLALAALSIQRSRASDAVSDIDLRFTFYYRKGP